MLVTIAQVDWVLTGGFVAFMGAVGTTYAVIYRLYIWAGKRMDDHRQENQAEMSKLWDRKVDDTLCEQVQKTQLARFKALKESMDTGFANLKETMESGFQRLERPRE